MEELLDAVLELVGLVLADVLEPGPVVAERGIRHRGFEFLVVDPVELEHEEQEMRGGGREALLHVAVKFRARRIDRVAGMDEPRIGGEPPEQVVEPLEALDRLRERAPAARPLGEPRELALEILLERDRIVVRPIEIALHRRVVDAGVEVGEVPLGQGAEGKPLFWKTSAGTAATVPTRQSRCVHRLPTQVANKGHTPAFEKGCPQIEQSAAELPRADPGLNSPLSPPRARVPQSAQP